MKSFLILIFLFFCNPAFSRLYFDADIGYGLTLDQDISDDYPQFHGVEIGTRLGLGHGVVILGADAAYAWTNSEYSSGSEYNMNKLDLGVFFGFEFLKLLRIWGSYYFETKMDYDSPGSYSLKGTAAGGGLGLTVLPFVSINAEAKLYNMNKITNNGTTTTVTGDEKLKPLEILLSIGFVF